MKVNQTIKQPYEHYSELLRQSKVAAARHEQITRQRAELEAAVRQAKEALDRALDLEFRGAASSADVASQRAAIAEATAALSANAEDSGRAGRVLSQLGNELAAAKQAAVNARVKACDVLYEKFVAALRDDRDFQARLVEIWAAVAASRDPQLSPAGGSVNMAAALDDAISAMSEDDAKEALNAFRVKHGLPYLTEFGA